MMTSEECQEYSEETILDSHTKMICSECKKSADFNKWVESWVGCELCGDHDAAKCPECGELHDHVDAKLITE